MIKYIIIYKITNNKKDQLVYNNFQTAKEIYIALQYNLTIKAAKLYEQTGKRKKLIEKFNKKNIITLNGEKIK